VGNKSRKSQAKKQKINEFVLLVRDGLFYFLVGSYVGHLIEIGLCKLAQIVMRATSVYDIGNCKSIFNNLIEPYTIYGMAGVFLFLFNYYFIDNLWKEKWKKWKLWLKIVVLYLIFALMCAVLEFSVAWFYTATLGSNPYWDYSDMPFNLFGFICLRNTLFFGLASLAFLACIRGVNQLLRDKLKSWMVWLMIGALAGLFAVFYLTST